MTQNTMPPIVYVLRDASGDLFKTQSYQVAKRMHEEYKAFDKSVWVDLITPDGEPHPVVTESES